MTTLQVRGSASSHSTSPATPASTAPATARPDTPRSYRPDIEGLRAVAVLTVVLYHAGLGLPGGYVGVDVFFVISGFLITRQLVGSVEARGIAALPVFYAHRVRRLLPAAVLVVVATVAAARMWAPVLQVRDIAVDAVVTTVYGLNYRLAAAGTDYQHLGTAASPLQHFWSLAVEEQFYLLWPLVVAALLAAGRSRGRLLLGVAVAAVVVASSIASVQVTSSSAPWAYFSLHTRAWELGVGALLALTAVPLSRVPRRLAGLCGWTGLVAIVAAAARYSDATPFPGTAAWLPVGGAAAVIAAGCGPRVGVERVLGEPLIQCLGRISYAWYLWHWPMLVLAPHVVGHELSTLESCAVLWLSLATSLVTYLLVEEPARRIRLPTLRWLGVGVLLSGTVGASAVLVVVLAPTTTGSGAAARLAPAAPGAQAHLAVRRAVAAGLEVKAVPRNVTPAPADAADSLPPTSRNGCHAGFAAVSQGACAYGDVAARRTVVLFGDSHVEQWLPAFDAVGSRQRLRVVSWTKAACPAAGLPVRNPALNRAYVECDQWRTATIDKIRRLRPALVVVGQSENVASSSVPPDTFAAATVATVRRLGLPAGSMIYLHDIPIPGEDLPGCVADNLEDVGACSFARSGAYTYPDRHEAVASAVRAADVRVVDPADWLCAEERCPAVVGNVLVYRNESHITVPYSRWLAPALWSSVRDAARASAPSPPTQEP